MKNKTEINRAALIRAVNLVRPALANQAYIPALTHIKFDGHRATAYNDISAISVAADFELQCCIPGDLLIKTLNSFGGDNIAFQGGGDVPLVLSSGRSKIKLPTLDVSNFPFQIDLSSGGHDIIVDESILKGIERCLVSVSNDSTHPAQMGVTLDTDKKGNAVLFSTDNFTISRYQTKNKIKLPGDAPIILPTFFCEQLIGMAKALKSSEITLILLANGLCAEFGNNGDDGTLFTKTLVDLEPLDFFNIFEKYCKATTICSCDLDTIPDAFDGAINRALLILGGEVAKSTKITLYKDKIELHTSSPFGDSDDVIEFNPAFPDLKPFFVDPSHLARAAKTCTSMAFLPKVVLMASQDLAFLHLIAHVSN